MIKTDEVSEQDCPRPSPATDHNAEKLDVEDPDFGYDAEHVPY
jgi:hypothetical protein